MSLTVVFIFHNIIGITAVEQIIFEDGKGKRNPQKFGIIISSIDFEFELPRWTVGLKLKIKDGFESR